MTESTFSDPVPSAADHGATGADPVERVREGAHRLVDSVADRAAIRTSEFGAVQERWVGELQDKVARQPITAIAVAAAAGVLLGRLLDRR